MYQPQEPLVLQLVAAANECLRVQADFQQADMEMVLISPTGRIWDDDNAGGDIEPLIKVAPVPATGWYTLHINNASGAAANQAVEVSYGRYTPATNPNCARPTPPLVNDVLSPAVQAAPSWCTDPQTGEVVYDEE
jgi:hypothetical protein